MTATDFEILERIKRFSFDPGAPAFSFAARLAKDNGWTELYALRVLEEYRRFAFLAVAAGHLAVPSDQVDQAWHQHILFSESWTDFCRTILGRKLNHEPARAEDSGSGRFKAGYEQTIDSYRRFFGEPPADIWPGAAVRFGRDLHYRRVNTATHFAIPKAWLVNLGILACTLAGTAVLVWWAD
jgi:hypothetical protein